MSGDFRPIDPCADNRCPLPLPVGPSPALTALVNAQQLSLIALRSAIEQPDGDLSREIFLATTEKQLRLLAGTFRFCGAQSLEMLCWLMLELVQNSGDRPLPSGALHALDCACSHLLASLPSLQQGRAVAAGALLPAWRELAAHLPGSAPSPSAMITLSHPNDPEAVHVAQAFLGSYTWSPTEVSVSVGDIDKILLELLRAEPGSERLHDSLSKVAAVISLVRQHAQDQRDHLRWTLILIYCEHLLADAPMDLALAKKNLSAVMRAVRQVAQRSAELVVMLPDRLMQDVLFQIGLFAPVTSTSQSVRDGFALDWQLRPGPDLAITERMNEQKRQLLASLDEIELAWPCADPGQRRRHMEAIVGRLQAMPALASVGDSLLGLWTHDESNGLLLAAGLLMARAAADALDDKSSSYKRNAALLALEAMSAHAKSAFVADVSLWNELGCLAPDLQRSAALGALRTAILTTLTDAERKADAMVESGNVVAALHELILSVDRVIGALSLVGKSAAVQMAASLKKSLCATKQHAASTASDGLDADMQKLALQWVQLHEWADAWPAGDHADHDHTDSRDIHGACDRMDASAGAGLGSVAEISATQPSNMSLNELASHVTENSTNHAPGSGLNECRPADRLEQIFIQEATQRLSRLNQAVSTWANNPAVSLPLEVANEAHGLAGSSATVGRRRLHDGALALEQVVDHLVNLPLERQHGYADALMQSVRALEQELHSTLTIGSADPAEQDVPDNADALSELLKSLADLSDCPPDASNHPPSENAPDDQAAQSYSCYPSHPSDQLDQYFPSEAAQPSPRSIDRCRTEHANDPLIPDELGECDAAFNLLDDTLSAHTELFAVFSEEAAELMPLLAQQMEVWLAAPRDDTQRSGVLRLLHTLKGSARMAGETVLGERLHRMEHEVAQFARADSFSDHELNGFRHELAELLAEAGLLSTRAVESNASSAAHAASLPEPLEVERALAERSPTEAAGLAPKIRNDLLERATGSAAELLVGAVRASEELQRQRQTVTELAENLLRLRNQLRELELQSESRITAHAQPSASVFDPLEFDRYTRLQELTRMTAESLADLTSLQRTLGRQSDSTVAMLSQQTRHARSLQSDLRRVGMQAFSSIEPRLRRLVRQVAAETGRDVRFEIEGARIEIDRQQLDRLNGALQHLIRNAIVHGIETPVQREQAGKPRCGLVRVLLGQQGGELRLQISDDGRGLDVARIRARACALGVLSETSVIDDAQLAELIFHPGLSTAEQVTGLAGRGIGMDAVKEAVMQMGGALKVDSLSGEGTCITLGLPQLLSTQQVLVVSDGTQSVALPASMVQQVMQLNQSVLRHAITTGSLEWQRQTMPLRSLSDLYGACSSQSSDVLRAADSLASGVHRPSVVILRQLDQWMAIRVGEVIGHREVVVKQTGLQLAGVPGLAGATLQADGSVLLIMNLLQWFDYLSLHHRITQTQINTDTTFDKTPLVMVVDDSLTVRRVSQRLLERHGYRVSVARHGLEALEQLRDITPAALLLDIEMPRMDGFELLSRIRADVRLKSMPVAMVTSRAAERHRSHAMQLGANAYFGKPYRDQELFDWLNSCAPIRQNSTSAT